MKLDKCEEWIVRAERLARLCPAFQQCLSCNAARDLTLEEYLSGRKILTAELLNRRRRLRRVAKKAEKAKEVTCDEQ